MAHVTQAFGSWSNGQTASSFPHAGATRSTRPSPKFVRKLRSGAGRAQSSAQADYRRAGPAGPPVDYTDIDSRPLNRAIMQLFRQKMVQALDADSSETG